MNRFIKKIEQYYESEYFNEKCYEKSGEPCGPDRCRLSGQENVFRAPSLPAIGPRYGEKRKVVFVGINPNYRRNDEVENQTAARNWFTRYFHEEDNQFWSWNAFRKGIHRMAHIAIGDDQEDSDECCPYVAWTNIIKCASSYKRARPSYSMWINCPPKIWGELEILKPDLIITLGPTAHESLSEGAAHRREFVRIPKYPWNNYWSEITISKRPTPVFCGFHPSGLQPIRSDMKAINKNKRPKTQKTKEILEELTGSKKLMDWKSAISEYAKNHSEPLCYYIEKNMIAPDAQKPKYF